MNVTFGVPPQEAHIVIASNQSYVAVNSNNCPNCLLTKDATPYDTKKSNPIIGFNEFDLYFDGEVWDATDLQDSFCLDSDNCNSQAYFL